MSDDEDDPLKKAMIEMRRDLFGIAPEPGEPYAVGYRKPPLATRFRKGRSGNPAGRKPKARLVEPMPVLLETHEAVLEAARRVVSGGVAGTPPVTAVQAVLKALFKAAMQGNAVAQREYLLQAEKAEALERQVIEEDHAFWSAYVDICRAEIAAAKRDGKPLPDHLPHPDDIVIETGKPVVVEGPQTQEQRDAYESLMALRDVLILQWAMEEAPMRAPPGQSGALLLARLINQRLMGRYRLSDERICGRVAGLQMINTPRQLLKATRQGWRQLGLPMRRGQTFPPLEQVHATMETIAHRLESRRTPKTLAAT